MSLAFLIIYSLGVVYTARMIGRNLAWEYGEPSTDDFVMGVFLGALCGLVWPVSLPIALIAQREHIRDMILGVPKDRELERREREIRHREYEVRKLERELGIGQ